jgi:hypothetical protein
MNTPQQLPVQPQIPIQDAQEPSEESKQLITLFNEMESRQLEFLDESGKSLIERVATFLAILFGVSILSPTFPPSYLKGNMTAKGLVIGILACYLGAMAAGMWAIQPRPYRRYLYNVSRLKSELEKITKRKTTWLRVGGILFVLGSVALALLIIWIVWGL